MNQHIPLAAFASRRIAMQTDSIEPTVTLQTVFDDYVSARRALKPSTIRDYRKRLRAVPDWLDMPVTAITKDMIQARHRQLSTANGPRGSGEAQANVVMRVLRALLTYAQYAYEDADGKPVLAQNPVRRLSEVRAWNRDKRRRSMISRSDLPAWWREVQALKNGTVRDFLVLLFLTGLRRNEAARLRWIDVDFVERLIRIPSTKNGLEHILPLPDYLLLLLKRRAELATSEWVFPGRRPGTCLSSAFRSYQLVAQRSGVAFCLHDLRRGFISVADELDIKHETIAALVNHKSNSVTDGYIIRSVERLRQPMELITQELLRRVTPVEVKHRHKVTVLYDHDSPGFNGAATIGAAENETRISGTDQILVEAKIIQLLKRSKTANKKRMYSKLGGPSGVNRFDIQRILLSMIERGILAAIANDFGGFDYCLAPRVCSE